MKRTAIATTLVLALTFSFLFCGKLVPPVKSQSSETIFIRADGSVEGTTKIHREGNTYSFADDITGYIVVERDDVTIDGADHAISGGGPGSFGLLLSERLNVTIRNISVIGFDIGIYLRASSNIHILESNILENDIGIVFGGYWVVITRYDYFSTNNTSVIKNNIAGNNVGVDLGMYSPWNDISGNNFTKNQIGIKGMSSNDNIIVGNSFVENNGFAIHISDSRNNTIYHNNFIDNKVVDSIQIFANWYVGYNAWDNGYEGNYWSDYITRYPNASEVDSSGIWDTPFYIKEENMDNYPLVYPWDVPPEIKVLNLENSTHIGSFSLNFTVNKPAKWMGYSLDGEANVTVSGNVTLMGLSSGLHNVTIYSKDEFDNTGVSETITFNVQESFPVLPVAAASGVSIAAVAVGLLVYFKKRKR